MMYRLFFLIAFLPCKTLGQFALSDALKLLPAFDEEFTPSGPSIAGMAGDSTDFALAVLAPYGDKAARSCAVLFPGNPFLGTVSGTSIVLLPCDTRSNPLISEDDKTSPQPPPSSSGLSVNNLADGLGRFLAKRTKEELTLAFFRRFKNAIEHDPTLKILFPATKEQLWVIDSEIYFYERYIEALRESFIVDMKNLPHHLRQYLQDENIVKSPYRRILMEDLLESGQYLLDKRPLTEWFDYLASEAAMQDNSRRGQVTDIKEKARLQDIAATFKVIRLLSESLRAPQGSGSVWMDPATARAALRDPKVLYTYLGLLWQKGDGITFSNGATFRSGLEKMAAGTVSVQKIGSFISQWLQSGKEMSQSVQAFETSARQDSVADEQAFRYFDTFFALSDGVLDLQRTLFQTNKDSSAIYIEEAENALFALQHLSQFHYNIRRKNYVYAVHSLSGLLQRALGEDFESKATVLRYTNFIASVAEADDSREVAAALEAFAMPPGSSALKKHSAFSVSINAYTGFSIGSEYLDSLPGQMVASFSAPVGFGFNIGLGKGGSLSLFAPVLDVGALTAFRLKDEESADLPELKWENILSPGLYLVYGCAWDLPLALGVGFQQGPNLRKVKPQGQSEFVNAKGYRFGAFLSIDIPITHLFTR